MFLDTLVTGSRDTHADEYYASAAALRWADA